ncbi:MAG: helix-turn-helix transcriptional regulator [Lachnospiraceae bacterium]|nr:helix-turn-helix transcriptional regulator [Lachnospiraceae bacterium]
MKTLNEYLAEQMGNAEFRKEYERVQPEIDIMRAMIDARISQNMTQKELAEKTGINQSDISKIENGTRNPSLNLLKKLAEGMDMVLRLQFIPKSQFERNIHE